MTFLDLLNQRATDEAKVDTDNTTIASAQATLAAVSGQLTADATTVATDDQAITAALTTPRFVANADGTVAVYEQTKDGTGYTVTLAYPADAAL